MDPENNFSKLNTSLFSDINLDFLESRFGVELEVCVKVSPDCIQMPHPLINFENTMTIKNKFDFFYTSILQKSSTFDLMASTYEYCALLMHTPSGIEFYFYTMTKPDEPALERKEIQDAALANSLVRRLARYEIPMFADDMSIICGDSQGALLKEGAGIQDPYSFRFECITPVLSIEGHVTQNKVRETVVPFLQFFGLESPNCFILNYSMGFHVNASLYIPEKGKYIAIGVPPFLNKLLRKYIAMERYLYRAVRTRKQAGANDSYVSNYARPLYENLNRFQAESGGLSAEEIMNTKMTENDYIEEKKKAIKRKSPYLLEFRLFEGDSDMERLVHHVFITLHVLQKTVIDILHTKGKKGLLLTKNIHLGTVNQKGSGSRNRKRHAHHRRQTRKIKKE